MDPVDISTILYQAADFENIQVRSSTTKDEVFKIKKESNEITACGCCTAKINSYFVYEKD